MPLPKLVLQRLAETPFGVLGALTGNNLSLCAFENKWRGGVNPSSCLPLGEYMVSFEMSVTGQVTYRLTSEDGLGNRFIHTGKTWNEPNGGIIVGTDFGTPYGDLGVVNTKVAVDALHDSLQGSKEFILTITETHQTYNQSELDL